MTGTIHTAATLVNNTSTTPLDDSVLTAYDGRRMQRPRYANPKALWRSIVALTN